MKKTLLLALVFCGLWASLNAAIFTGKVTDTSGTGLASVNVLVVETNQTTITDAEGNWTIESDNDNAITFVFHKEGFTYEQIVGQNPSSTISMALRQAKKSAATLRQEDYIENDCAPARIPNDEVWDVNFEISTLKGDLAPDNTYTRRDPSAVILVDGTYYMWYSYSLTFDKQKLAPWDLNDLYYATSKDGITWDEKGVAVPRGEAGAFDHRSVFTCEIIAAEGQYYLVYQAAADENGIYNRNTVGMSYAETPDGPWTKLENPVLHPTYTNDLFFDNNAVHDPCIVPYKGQYYLYYKGECNCRDNADCARWCDPACGLRKQVKWGVAIADSPTGPYVKSAYNPVTNTGHEVMVWPYADGMAILQHQDGPEALSIQFAEDGLNFDIKGTVGGFPEAAGLYRSEKSDDDPHAGIQWGVGHKLKWDAGPKGWMYIYRFDKK